MRDLVEHRGGWKANFFLFALLALDDRVGENNNGDDLPASEQYRKLEREREREREMSQDTGLARLGGRNHIDFVARHAVGI